MDALARRGLRFTQVFPEAMPTVPARNSILTGRPSPAAGTTATGLLDAPGGSRSTSVDRSLMASFRRASYWTAYVTDNPFLAYAPAYGRFATSVHRFVRTGGQIGGHQPISSVPDHILRHWIHPSYDIPKARSRVAKYLANSHPWEGLDHTFAGRVFQPRHPRAGRRGRAPRPFAMVVDTYEPHEPWTPPPGPRRVRDGGAAEPADAALRRAVELALSAAHAGVLGRMRDLYAAEVTMTDYWLGHLIDRLHDLNLERETVIALVADHGISSASTAGPARSRPRSTPALTRVPMIIVHPRPAARRPARATSPRPTTWRPRSSRMAGCRRPSG